MPNFSVSEALEIRIEKRLWRWAMGDGGVFIQYYATVDHGMVQKGENDFIIFRVHRSRDPSIQ
jgi:hypothetical protein